MYALEGDGDEFSIDVVEFNNILRYETLDADAFVPSGLKDRLDLGIIEGDADSTSNWMTIFCDAITIETAIISCQTVCSGLGLEAPLLESIPICSENIR